MTTLAIAALNLYEFSPAEDWVRFFACALFVLGLAPTAFAGGHWSPPGNNAPPSEKSGADSEGNREWQPSTPFEPRGIQEKDAEEITIAITAIDEIIKDAKAAGLVDKLRRYQTRLKEVQKLLGSTQKERLLGETYHAIKAVEELRKTVKDKPGSDSLKKQLEALSRIYVALGGA